MKYALLKWFFVIVLVNYNNTDSQSAIVQYFSLRQPECVSSNIIIIAREMVKGVIIITN